MKLGVRCMWWWFVVDKKEHPTVEETLAREELQQLRHDYKVRSKGERVLREYFDAAEEALPMTGQWEAYTAQVQRVKGARRDVKKFFGL